MLAKISISVAFDFLYKQSHEVSGESGKKNPRFDRRFWISGNNNEN